MMSKRKLIVSVFFVLLASIVGCSSMVTKSVSIDKVPFLLMLSGNSVEQSPRIDNATVYCWDLLNGNVSFDQKPLFKRVTVGETMFRLAWDGDKQVLLNTYPYPGTSIKIKDFRADIKPLELKPTVKKPLAVFERYSETGCLVSYFEPIESNNAFEIGKIVVENRNGGQIQRTELTPDLPQNANGPYPLMIFGTPEKYSIIATYNKIPTGPQAAIMGGLLVGEVSGKNARWRQVKGSYCSFIADAGSGLAKIKDKVYITCCGGLTKVLDLKGSDLKLEDFKPAIEAMKELKQKYTDFPVQPNLGAYNDVLLMTAQGLNDKWLWALSSDRCIGKIIIDSGNKTARVYKDGKLVSKLTLNMVPTQDEVQLPRTGFGTFK